VCVYVCVCVCVCSPGFVVARQEHQQGRRRRKAHAEAWRAELWKTFSCEARYNV
jgi:hypothetical protein